MTRLPFVVIVSKEKVRLRLPTTMYVLTVRYGVHCTRIVDSSKRLLAQTRWATILAFAVNRRRSKTQLTDKSFGNAGAAYGVLCTVLLSDTFVRAASGPRQSAPGHRKDTLGQRRRQIDFAWLRLRSTPYSVLGVKKKDA